MMGENGVEMQENEIISVPLHLNFEETHKMKKVNIAIFVSGGGTNCENIIRYFKDSEEVCTALVISNKAEAPAVGKALKLGVPVQVVSKTELNDEGVMMSLLRQYAIDFIVLAGFLPLIPDFLVETFPRRIINIHPSLLPKYGGKGMWGHHVHEAVKAAGETETGMTVHWVTPVCDGGDIIAQYRVALLPEDSAETISDKEHVLEMKYYPLVIQRVLHEIF